MAELGPAMSVKAITPHDTNPQICRALYIGGSGDVAVQAMEDNAPQIFKAVPAGRVLPVSVRLVRATGTTATNILGLS